jgi:hypothetical protein
MKLACKCKAVTIYNLQTKGVEGERDMWYNKICKHSELIKRELSKYRECIFQEWEAKEHLLDN